MDSSSNYNIHSHYHHLHDQNHPTAANGSSSSSSSSSSSPSLDNPASSSTSSSCFGVVNLHAADSHQWTPNTTLINSNYKLTTLPNSDPILKPSTSSSPHENFNSMSQNPTGFQWPELGDIPTNNTFPKFTDMLINGTTSNNILDDDLQLCPSSYMKSNNDLSVELSQKLMLKTLLSSTSRAMEDDEFHFNGGGTRGFVFSQIHPSVNISNPTSNNYQSSSSSSWSTFDLLSSARFSDDHKEFTGNSVWSERERGDCGFYDHGKDQLYKSSSSSSFDHVSRSYGDHKTMDAKRPSSSVETKAQTGSKKTRLESRPSSCPPMKVRKEKLGDRIAALQQLVAPFGKTDTASVLMEAIGYIKFLQNQIQTLSVPYMKRNDNNRTSQRGNGEADLKSRGLCLVPLTCMSYVTNDGAGVWPPPNFRGGI